MARLHYFYLSNAPKAIAPFGAKEKVLGTNPVAFAAPGEEDPLVTDLAVSAVTRGKIRAADRAGQNIPCGWASGLDGEPTTDPQTALRGSMVPIGGAKGAALALLVEVMSACLAGAALSREAESLFEGAGDPPNLGQVLLAIDAQALSAQSYSSPLSRSWPQPAIEPKGPGFQAWDDCRTGRLAQYGVLQYLPLCSKKS